MKSILVPLFVLLLVCATQVSANIKGCHVTLDAQSRQTSYENAGLTNIPYDIYIVNVGTCPVNILYITLTPGIHAEIVQTFNLLQLDSTHYWVENYGNALEPSGQYSGAGFIEGVSSANAGVSVNLAGAICETSGDCAVDYVDGENLSCENLDCDCRQVCIQDGGLPRCETVYQTCSSTTSSITTTSGTTSTTGSPVSGCSVSASIAARAGGSWQDSGVTNQIYDITVTNGGSCALSSVRLQFSLSAGSTIASSWNLDSNYYLENFGSSINPGGLYNGAGVVVAGGGSVSVSIASKACSHCSV